jgi:integrase/recombinase XerC
MNQLVPIRPGQPVFKTPRGIAVPAVIAAAGDHAVRRFLEFFAATIRNRNTRMAYYRAVTEFFTWVERHKIGQLVDIEPLHVAAYVEALGTRMAKPTVKQHLAAVRAAPLPIAATVALDMIGPMPGTVISRSHAGS